MALVLLLVSVDVENPQTPFYAGRYAEDALDLHLAGEPLGATRIAAECEAVGARATFFLDVFEHPRIGVEPLAELALALSRRGHAVELHTHPVWVDPHGRRLMWELSSTEQRELVREGAAMLRSWTGVAPRVHRAGAYGADERTLLALAANGIGVDGSAFFGHPSCRLPAPLNALSRRAGVLLMPVTGFWQTTEVHLGSRLRVRARSSFCKVDIDACDEEELTWFLEHARARERPAVVNLFAHGYSLWRLGPDGVARPEPSTLTRLRSALRAAQRLGYRFGTFRDLLAEVERAPWLVGLPDEVPRRARRVPLAPLERAVRGAGRLARAVSPRAATR